MQANAYNGRNAYKRADVETASQGKLVAMLFNGAIQRVEEARRLAAAKDPAHLKDLHALLVRSQEIVAELRTSLDIQAGEIALQLDSIYEYIFHLLVQANIKKDGTHLEEALRHLTEMRDMWAEAFANAEREGGTPATRINPHGSAVMNLEG
jgi:flagellar protein FliS